MAVVVEHEVRLEARALERRDQEAACLRRRIQRALRRLPAGRAQEPDHRRPAVRRGGIEAAQDDVEAREERVSVLPGRLQVVPRERAHVEQDHVERRAALGRPGERDGALRFVAEERIQPRIGSGRRPVGCGGDRGGRAATALGPRSRQDEGHGEHRRHHDRVHPHEAREDEIDSRGHGQQGHDGHADEAPRELGEVGGAEARDEAGLLEHPRGAGKPGVVVEQGHGDRRRHRVADAAQAGRGERHGEGRRQRQVLEEMEADQAAPQEQELGDEVEVPGAQQVRGAAPSEKRRGRPGRGLGSCGPGGGLLLRFHRIAFLDAGASRERILGSLAAIFNRRLE